MTEVVYYRFRLRRGLAAALASVNETPLDGELVVEKDTGRAKLGDGVTPWNSLPNFALPGAIDLAGLTNGDVLAWHAGSGTWKPTTPSGGGGGSATFPFTVQPFIPGAAWTFQWGVFQATGAENSGIPTTGVGLGSLGAVTPTVPTHSPHDLTSTFRRQPRRRYTSAAGAGNQCGSRNGSLYMCGTGGYAYAVRFGFADPAPVANARCFIGVRNAIAGVANADPSTFISCIGVGADSGDANLHLMHNDGSGTCTKTDLGANFPANTSDTDFYELQIYCAPGGTSVEVFLRNLTNGSDTSATITTDMPAPSDGLGYIFWRNNGSTALAVEIHFGTQAVALSLE